MGSNASQISSASMHDLDRNIYKMTSGPAKNKTTLHTVLFELALFVCNILRYEMPN